jgi:HEAT repeat protein
LIAALKDAKADVREQAATALGRIGEEASSAVKPLAAERSAEFVAGFFKR